MAGSKSKKTTTATPTPSASSTAANFKCTRPGCAKSYTQDKYRKRHEKTHDPPDVPCLAGCNERFTRSDLRARHHRKKHTAEENAAAERKIAAAKGVKKSEQDYQQMVVAATPVAVASSSSSSNSTKAKGHKNKNTTPVQSIQSNNNHPCAMPRCGAVESSADALLRHWDYEHTAVPCKLADCSGETFPSRRLYDAHALYEHGPFLCIENGCGATEPTRTKISGHGYHVHGKTPKFTQQVQQQQVQQHQVPQTFSHGYPDMKYGGEVRYGQTPPGKVYANWPGSGGFS